MRFLLAAVLLVSFLNAHASLRFASYNIRNFDYDERSNTPTNKTHLIKTIKEMNADFMAVQEINEPYIFNEMIRTQFKGKYAAQLTECGGTHGQKLGFVYNRDKFKLINFKEDMRSVNPNNPRQSTCTGSRPIAIGKFLRLDNNEVVIALSVHLKSGGQPKSISKRFKQLNIITAIINSYKKSGVKNFVVMGDFNSTEYIFKGSIYNKFIKTINNMGVVDVSKSLKCTAYWWGGQDDQTQYPSQLDHILMSQSLAGKTEVKIRSYGHCQKLKCQASLESSMGVDFDEVSDHCPIVSEVK